MITRKFVYLATTFMFALVLTGTGQATSRLVDFNSHKLDLTLDTVQHTALVTDTAAVSLWEGWNAFVIAKHVDIQLLSIGDMKTPHVTARMGDPGAFPEPLDSSGLSNYDDDSLTVVFFENKNSGESRLTLRYTATLFQDVDNVRFSSERVGNEVSGTILTRGAYLSPAAAYYPQGAEQLSHYTLTLHVPDHWTAIGDGNPEAGNGGGTFKFENPYPSDGLYLFAAPFVEGKTTAAGVDISCLFFPDDTGLIQDYLQACVGYINMYDELIGAYPYSQFSVVENFFPTGYGMPGWTLLGQQVLRLPFIKYTSLGHEVLHNWWGNSVLVDYDRGNWCEGLTVYGADYRYKLMQSPEAAEAYRKDILKQYLSYVNEGNDFPLRDFTSRSSPETRTIGYNKAMMVFHMINDEIGDSAFYAAWQLVYDKYKGVKISWSEWIDAYEATSGQDLSWIIPQWINRTGAPYLSVNNPLRSDDGTTVTFTLTDASPEVYRLSVPVRLTTEAGDLDTTVLMSAATQEYALTAGAPISALTVDPTYDLFRRLHADEAEPVISATLGHDTTLFVSAFTADSQLSAFSDFARMITGDTGDVSILQPSAATVDGASIIMYGGDYTDSPLGELVSVSDDSIIVAGKAYPLAGHTFVFSTRDIDGFDDGLVIESGDVSSLPRIGQLLPHYGKYSYLVFEGAKNVDKGQWPVTSSPMTVKFQD